ncbi:hypothetical protein M1555_04185 [Patescibacteria group bacterium]|nr:hypothetical protein [Patescibacteria group bacterium]
MEQVFAQDVIGKVNVTTLLPGGYHSLSGIGLFFSNVLRLLFVAAGILAFLNLIIAGYQYITAGGDAKALEKAWSRIWQSLVGLILIVGSFALAALFGYIIFGDAGFILNPKVYGP